MAKLISSSQQSQTIILQPNVVTEIDFRAVGGAFPNIFQIFNYGTATVICGLNPLVTVASNYEFMTAGASITVYGNPQNQQKLFFLTTVGCTIRINCWVSNDITTSELSQTTNSVIVNSSVTSSVNIAAAIPAGTNAIGHVVLDAGSAAIGHVIVDTTPTTATTVADGVNISLGAKADAAAANGGVTGSAIAFLKGILTSCQAATPAGANNIGKVTIDSTTSLPTGANTIGNVGLVAGANVIGKVNIVDFPIAVPTLYNVSLAAISTEYSQAITNAHKIIVSIQSGASTDSFRLAFATGKVATPTAPYLQYAQSVVYLIEDINIASFTLYLATTKAGVVAQIEVW